MTKRANEMLGALESNADARDIAARQQETEYASPEVFFAGDTRRRPVLHERKHLRQRPLVSMGLGSPMCQPSTGRLAVSSRPGLLREQYQRGVTMWKTLMLGKRASRTSLGYDRLELSRDVWMVDNVGSANILDFGRGRFLALNTTATRTLQALFSDGRTKTIHCLVSKYGITADRARGDVDRLIGQLSRRQIVVDRREQHGVLSHRRWCGVSWLVGHFFRTCLRVCLRVALQLAGYKTGPPTRSMVAFFLSMSWVVLRCYGWTASLRLFEPLHRRSASFDANRDEVRAIDRLVRELGARSFCLPKVCRERAFRSVSTSANPIWRAC